MSIIRITEGENITAIEQNWTVFTDHFEAYAGNNSHFTAKNGTFIGEPKKDISEEKKYFVEGWWSSDADGKNRIIEAFIEDTVYFNIITQSIPDIDPITKKPSEIAIQLYDDDGSWGNSPDPINVREVKKDPVTGKDIKGDLVTSKTVTGNKVSYSLTLNKGLVSFIEEDAGDEIELYFECGYKNERNVKLPASSANYLKVFEKEVKITVLVELPHSKETGWAAKGLGGHTAMAVGDRYFDYGPDNRPGTYSEKDYDVDFNGDGDKDDDVLLRNPSFENAPGRPWWGRMVAQKKGIQPEDVKLNDVLSFILQHWSICNVYGEVHKIEFYAKGSQSDKMIEWWEERYKHLKIYSVWPWKGEQCTTAVKTALQEGGFYIPDETQKPSGMLSDLKGVLSTTKNHFLERAHESIIKPESSDWNPN
ncbi:hypothetical protein [Chryseobacterium gleum]|uniref:hypothetical protein n=2 Tax=Chryseobacterium gleum TaxID=250 RepID=UPI0028A05237|nr:hypothetical protein [Chryseobacterium gleum]